MEAPLLHGGGDYPPMRSWREVRSMVWAETVKLWRVAGPLAFQILCQFGTNSMINVFVGHIGNLELSAVSISLSVIGTFSFGFLFPLFVWLPRKEEKRKKNDCYVICFCYYCYCFCFSIVRIRSPPSKEPENFGTYGG